MSNAGEWMWHILHPEIDVAPSTPEERAIYEQALREFGTSPTYTHTFVFPEAETTVPVTFALRGMRWPWSKITVGRIELNGWTTDGETVTQEMTTHGSFTTERVGLRRWAKHWWRRLRG